MSAISITRLGLMVGAVLFMAGAPAYASWTCNGTLVYCSSESTSQGSICGNDHFALHASDDVYECLREDTGDDLYHTWTFSNVPAGNLFLIYEGNRPASEGEYFKFSGTYDEGGGPIGVIMTGAVINKTFEPQGGIMYDMSVNTTNTSTFTLVIRDSNPNGSSQSNVYLDYVAICSEPVE